MCIFTIDHHVKCGFSKAKSGAVAYISKPNLEPLPISQRQIWSHCVFLKAKSGAIAYF